MKYVAYAQNIHVHSKKIHVHRNKIHVHTGSNQIPVHLLYLILLACMKIQHGSRQEVALTMLPAMLHTGCTE